ncbi:MAG: Chaperone protein DnaK [Parcubacteria group bacterium ADurb.Bin305]|nr:MAG: Chaperone protein DnaK [Parcubacteria group bacterium ADurb.Bin305]
MSKILGIDLGTSVSKMATIINGEPKCLESREGSVLIPSIVAITKNGERLVGDLAKRQMVTNPLNTIFEVKRFIGRQYDDPEIQAELKKLPYETRKSKDGGVEIKMGEPPKGGWFSPIEISSFILQKIKLDAEDKLGEKIESAVITCPANFDDSQRKATKTAGEIAGFKILRVINEPTAAALAYGLGRKKSQKVLVYDFGGGTFDVTILEIAPETVEVLATGGEAHLGGKDFDQALINWVMDQFKKTEGLDISKDPLALQRLKEAVEKAKIELSSMLETEINLPYISADASGPKHLYFKITRSQFENLVKNLVDKSIERVKKTLEEVKLDKSDIEEIVLVGGTTLIPLVRETVKSFFNKEPNKSINPEEIVAIGAAIEAEIITAAEEKRVPEGEIKNVLLLDVLPLSLGIETLGGVNTIMVPKNTTIPTSKSQIFSTAADNQSSVEINVLQGERPLAADCRSLGRFILDGLPRAPRGIPQIEVVFDIDANGLLSVTAKDKATGKSQSVRIEGSIGLSKEEIERLKREAELHAEEDRQKKELIETRNNAENLIYTAQKTLQDAQDKISAEWKSKIEEKLKALTEVKDQDDKKAIEDKIADLSKVLSDLGTELYKQASGETAHSQGEESEKSSDQHEDEEKPKDVDYEEK